MAAADLMVVSEDALGAPMTGPSPSPSPSPSAGALSGPSHSSSLPAAIRILSSLMQAMINTSTTTTTTTTATTTATAVAPAIGAGSGTDAISTTETVTDSAINTTTSNASTAAAAVAGVMGARTALFHSLQATAPCLSSSSSSSSSSDSLAAAVTDNSEAVTASGVITSSGGVSNAGGVGSWGWDQDAWLVFAACEIGSAEGKRRLDRWWSHFLQVIDQQPIQQKTHSNPLSRLLTHPHSHYSLTHPLTPVQLHPLNTDCTPPPPTHSEYSRLLYSPFL